MPTTIQIANIRFDVEPGDHQRFWKRVARGDWEPETYAIFDRFITRDSLFVDIGAWIGSTSLYGVQRADRCVAFEPDPVAFANLHRNVALNAGRDWVQRLQIHECAVNQDGASFTLGGSAEGSDSMSSALFPDRDSQWTVRAMRLDQILAEHRKPGQPVFIKIDIEGGEYDLLPGAATLLADPLVTAYVSFHPAMLRKALATPDHPATGEAAFVARHLAVTASLPWQRRIETSDGSPLDRQRIEQTIQRAHRFPREILICNP